MTSLGAQARSGKRGGGGFLYSARVIAIHGREQGLPRYVREGAPAEALARTEWLLTNGLGGYAMGTALGLPTRRYHGLLVAAMSPPVRRELMLHSFADTLVVSPGTAREVQVGLTPFAFRGGVVSPPPPECLLRFEKGLTCRWVYRLSGVEVVKEVVLFRERNAVSVSYAVSGSARLVLRPLVGMRDSHALLREGSGPPRPAGVEERGLTLLREATRLELWAEGAGFAADPQWWYGFEYARERERGFDHHEDLFSPGVFTLETGRGGGRAEITAWVGERPPARAEEQESQTARGMALIGPLPTAAPKRDDDQLDAMRRLVLAADAYAARRGGEGSTVVAGYPWFTDWGRDAMISLPGLFLVTGRHAEALAVLCTFAEHIRRGLIPNHFDEHTGEPRYNSADAPLWFLHAACAYLRASGDRAGFDGHLRPACLAIIDAYAAGTDFGIGVDPRDGLVRAGDAGTQLTWMDAQRDGVVFTPRHGKPVELSALWHHGLHEVAGAISKEEPERAARLLTMARRCADHFAGAFWNPAKRCLFDVLHPGPGGSLVPNDQVRPNQVFAVSLSHSPLAEREQRAVVQCIRSRLLTPGGLRTLDPADPAYIGRFEGPIARLDAAYHNGTAWPWLVGPFAEAVLRIGRFSPTARADARALLTPLIERLDGESLGQLPEVFDGDHTPEAPQRPGGCIAQAWSVAEVLRVYAMTLQGPGKA